MLIERNSPVSPIWHCSIPKRINRRCHHHLSRTRSRTSPNSTTHKRQTNQPAVATRIQLFSNNSTPANRTSSPTSFKVQARSTVPPNPVEAPPTSVPHISCCLHVCVVPPSRPKNNCLPQRSKTTVPRGWNTYPTRPSRATPSTAACTPCFSPSAWPQTHQERRLQERGQRRQSSSNRLPRRLYQW